MKQSFYITCAVAPDQQSNFASWRWSGDSSIGSGQGDGSQLQQVASTLADTTRIVLLLPTENLLLTSVDIPAKQAAQIRQAAPFAIEELVACDPAKLHVCSQRNADTGKVEVTAIERNYLSACLNELKILGIIPHQAYADIYTLPKPAAGELIISTCENSNRVLTRWGSHQGTAMQTTVFTDWLPLVINEQVDPAITRIQIIGAEEQPFADALANIAEIDVEYHITPNIADPATEPLALQAIPGMTGGFNLLSGDFRSTALVNGHQNWYKPLFLAATALALVIITAIMALQSDSSRVIELENSITSSFRSTFPAVQRIEDPMIQARQQLALLGDTSSGNSRFLIRLKEFVNAMQQQPGKIRIDSLEFREGILEIKLHAASIGELELLATTITQQETEASMSSASLSKDGVDALLVIKAAKL